ncbi:hypothetical protein ScPMuIL_013961 [Solemya velum]
MFMKNLDSIKEGDIQETQSPLNFILRQTRRGHINVTVAAKDEPTCSFLSNDLCGYRLEDPWYHSRLTGLSLTQRNSPWQKTADIVSPQFVSTGTDSLSIEFNWSSQANDSLEVILWTDIRNENVILTINSGKGERCIDIAEGRFQLIFRAILGYRYRRADDYISTVNKVVRHNYPCPGALNCSRDILNGWISSDCSLKPGSYCSFACKSGYFTPLVEPLRCLGLPNQEWSHPTNEICLLDECSREIQHGFFHSDCKFRRWEYCQFSCDAGYSRYWNDSLHCKSWKAHIHKPPFWSFDPSSLCSVQCSKSPDVYFYGCERWALQVCKFYCESRYEKVYDGTITCLPSGNWSTGSTPLCTKIAEIEEEGSLQTESIAFLAAGIGCAILITIILVIYIRRKKKNSRRREGCSGPPLHQPETTDQLPLTRLESPHSSEPDPQLKPLVHDTPNRSMGSRSDMNNREDSWNHAASVIASAPPLSEMESRSLPSAPPPSYDEVVKFPINPGGESLPPYDMCSASQGNMEKQ